MTERITNAEYRDSLRRSVVSLARAVIAGEIGPVAAARQLVALAHGLGLQDDEDFIFFRAIDSETDHFPIGDVRQRWDSTALAREDTAREGYESAVRADAIKRCRSLVERYDRDAV